ncbi:hypothetical protein EV126DRAFT_496859 [Verticillium dahliae]|nr:hypothetical protein VdG2_08739 [Verticillium dahliae VDG2]KAH6700803.1 hypothetical protein EV126DRAFT_496859 [Verticillium dahliae]
MPSSVAPAVTHAETMEKRALRLEQKCSKLGVMEVPEGEDASEVRDCREHPTRLLQPGMNPGDAPSRQSSPSRDALSKWLLTPSHLSKPHRFSGPGSLSVSTGIWLAVGGIGHCPWTPDWRQSMEVQSVLLVITHFLALGCAAEAWPGCGSPFFSAAVVGFGLVTSWAFLSLTRPYVFQGLFWSLSGLYADLLVRGPRAWARACGKRLAESAVGARASRVRG